VVRSSLRAAANRRSNIPHGPGHQRSSGSRSKIPGAQRLPATAIRRSVRRTGRHDPAMTSRWSTAGLRKLMARRRPSRSEGCSGCDASHLAAGQAGKGKRQVAMLWEFETPPISARIAGEQSQPGLEEPQERCAACRQRERERGARLPVGCFAPECVVDLSHEQLGEQAAGARAERADRGQACTRATSSARERGCSWVHLSRTGSSRAARSWMVRTCFGHGLLQSGKSGRRSGGKECNKDVCSGGAGCISPGPAVMQMTVGVYWAAHARRETQSGV